MRDHLSARMEQLIVSPLPCNYVCHARYNRPGVLACLLASPSSQLVAQLAFSLPRYRDEDW